LCGTFAGDHAHNLDPGRTVGGRERHREIPPCRIAPASTLWSALVVISTGPAPSHAEVANVSASWAARTVRRPVPNARSFPTADAFRSNAHAFHWPVVAGQGPRVPPLWRDACGRESVRHAPSPAKSCGQHRAGGPPRWSTNHAGGACGVGVRRPLWAAGKGRSRESGRWPADNGSAARTDRFPSS
jgi:hypothetical protein